MSFSKKHIVGIAAVAIATVYGLTRWRTPSEDTDERAPVTEYQTPADS